MNRESIKIVRAEYEGAVRYGFLMEDYVEWAYGGISSLKKTGDYAPIDQCRILAPVIPQKIIIIASNYNDKEKIPAQERAEPIVVLKPLTALIGPGDAIVYPQNTNTVKFEAEAAVVMGKPAKNIPVAKVMDHVLGFTLVNDVTDAEPMIGQWTFGKGHDTFLPMGPAIVVSRDYTEVTFQGYLNGVLVQEGHWCHLIRSVPELVSHVSDYMTLLPGDIICAGTPSGSGQLKRGDIFTVKNDFIGELTNRVI